MRRSASTAAATAAATLAPTARIAAAVTLTAGAVLALGAGAAHAADPATAPGARPAAVQAARPAAASQGCGTGLVCLYPRADWNDGHPSQQFYGTGVFHVAGLSGVHRVLDNRPTGTVRLCSTPDLSDCTTLTPGGYADYPFTSSTTLLVQP